MLTAFLLFLDILTNCIAFMACQNPRTSWQQTLNKIHKGFALLPETHSMGKLHVKFNIKKHTSKCWQYLSLCCCWLEISRLSSSGLIFEFIYFILFFIWVCVCVVTKIYNQSLLKITHFRYFCELGHKTLWNDYLLNINIVHIYMSVVWSRTVYKISVFFN